MNVSVYLKNGSVITFDGAKSRNNTEKQCVYNINNNLICFERSEILFTITGDVKVHIDAPTKDQQFEIRQDAK